MNTALLRRLASLFVAVSALQAGPALAVASCDLIQPREAAELLGTPAAAGVPEPDGCLIRSVGGAGGRIELSVVTIAPQDAARLLTHMDEERGDEVPSMHGDPWYEISAIDPARRQERIVVIHRDRTVLTVSLRTAGDVDQKAAVDAVWLGIAKRLPTDD